MLDLLSNHIQPLCVARGLKSALRPSESTLRALVASSE